MSDKKFDISRSTESDSGSIRLGLEKVITVGAVIMALSVMGNANTDLGINPVNYPAAAWFYLER